MKILNLNLHFFPDSIGGATVVAEKLAWGLVAAGHDVTNIYLSRAASRQEMTVEDTPFGRSVALNNIYPTGGNRFSSPLGSSMISEVAEMVQPDLIVVHAAQSLGVQDFLRDRKWLSRTKIVAHDFFWSCIQGFRTLPDGSRCTRSIGVANCRQCAWYPGLIDQVYRENWEILNHCREVIFPSEFLRKGYAEIFGREPDNVRVLSNPDSAELILPSDAPLPPAPGQAAHAAGKTVYGFVGGPGETKGWGLVRDFMALAEDPAAKTHVVLFDIGRTIGTPWYPRKSTEAVTIAAPYHWTYAAQALGQIDVMLMPSNVQESFGLAAREILALGGKTLIRRSGALAELEGYANVVVAEPGQDAATLASRLALLPGHDNKTWIPTTVEAYAAQIVGN
ncbi:glycosyltransferase [Paracoccus aminophilus]|uniref:Glycosyltransferase subfamily 4-like N-terminal domain-containing protein n=1 Tax=Paracoccus aminophilus JCM 7686 TaxID=1367847 RepID=S5YQ03_PARAH|nr:glycosyltransferase [Paracoccus aminophilus]AGT07381.1 hypothetical protein JCM7686_0270 [Paracoccus aminophilus JCM 7686]